MDFHPASSTSDRIGRLISLLEDIVSAETGSMDGSADHAARKMIFSTVKQQTSVSPDVFSRFYAFEQSVMDLQRTLQDFSNSVQHLGSSVGLVASAYHIRFRLDGILRLFRGNVSRIYPDHRLRLPPTRNLIDPAPRRKGDLIRAFHLVDASIQALPDECLELIKDLDRFLKRIKEIPDFTDDIVAELLESTIHILSEHMKEWMKSLSEYENLDWPDVRRFLDELSGEIQLDVERLSRSIASFVSVGIPMIEHSQKRKASGLLNTSTVATFFSGVSATALQYSIASHGTALQQLVNFSWTSALVFALASAVNSQIAYRWQVTPCSSPDPLVPAWLGRWLTDAPLLFLVVSVILFALGLVCFSFTAFGGTFIPITTSVFAGLSSVGLLLVGGWVIGEKIAFSQTKGHHWFREIMSNPKTAFGDHFSWARCLFRRDPAHGRFAGVRRQLRRIRHRVNVVLGLSDSRLFRFFRQRRPSGPILPTGSPALEIGDTSGANAEKIEERTPTPSVFQDAPRTPQRNPSPLLPAPESDGGRVSESSSSLLSPSTASRERTAVAPGSEVFETNTLGKKRGPTGTSHKRGPRVPSLHSWRHADMLLSLRNIVLLGELSDIEVPYPRVMAFSPSGNYLAALCPNQKVRVWDTRSRSMRAYKEIAPRDGSLQQIAWRPQYSSDAQSSTKDGRVLLLRSKNKTTIRLVDISKDQVSYLLSWRRPRTRDIKAMCWLREEPSFLWSEGSNIFIGYAERSSAQKGEGVFDKFYDFRDIVDTTIHSGEPHNANVVINDMLVIPGDRFLILTIALVPKDEEDDPAAQNPEHRVIIFNMKKKEIESYLATFNDVNRIAIHKSGMFVVISRRTGPPTVYELKNLQQPHKRGWFDPILVCDAPANLEFIGTSFLASVLPDGGQTVMSSTKDGVIHVWDRKFGTKLGELVPDDAIPGQIVDTIIWSQDQALMAIAYNKGAIRIFRVPAVLEST